MPRTAVKKGKGKRGKKPGPKSVEQTKMTTIKLSNGLHRALKLLAVEQGVTLGQLIEDGLRKVYGDQLAS